MCYSWIRFSSQKAFTDWVPISDGYFFIIYVTELWITSGLFTFLFLQTRKKATPEVSHVEEGFEFHKGLTIDEREDSLVHVVPNRDLGPGIIV